MFFIRKDYFSSVMIKRLIKILSFSFVVLFLYSCHTVIYGIQQGRGQLKIVHGADPIEDFLSDKDYPDSLKEKLNLVREIKAFAIDSLGINPSENYEKLYDQNGKPVMWVVTACDNNRLSPYYWKFPFLGKFSYKGFFDEKRAVKEETKLKNLGYDTDIGIVNAWSTLGWFKDPVMSSMLQKSPGQLARVIIHELTHGTLYVKNDIQFNENLASFVGDKGALMFLESKYGKGALEVEDYHGDFADMENVRNHLLRGTDILNDFYSSTDSLGIVENKRHEIEQIITSLDTLTLYNKAKLKNVIDNASMINNTFFTDFLTYRKEQNSLELEFTTKFNSDFKKYLTYLKNKYPSL